MIKDIKLHRCFIVNDLLQEYFPKIVDVGFTAAMENNLDEIAQGGQDWRTLLQEFYGPFVERIGQVEAEAPRVKVPEEITDIACENCGAPMAVKHGRFGAFLGCTRFPECRTTRPLVKEIGVACPMCEKPIVERKTKTGRIFYGCSDYPACRFISWNKPTGELCPVCGNYLVEKKYKNQPAVTECSNNDCPTRAGDIKPVKEKAESAKDDNAIVTKSKKASAKKPVAKAKPRAVSSTSKANRLLKNTKVDSGPPKAASKSKKASGAAKKKSGEK